MITTLREQLQHKVGDMENGAADQLGLLDLLAFESLSQIASAAAWCGVGPTGLPEDEKKALAIAYQARAKERLCKLPAWTVYHLPIHRPTAPRFFPTGAGAVCISQTRLLNPFAVSTFVDRSAAYVPEWLPKNLSIEWMSSVFIKNGAGEIVAMAYPRIVIFDHIPTNDELECSIGDLLRCAYGEHERGQGNIGIVNTMLLNQYENNAGDAYYGVVFSMTDVYFEDDKEWMEPNLVRSRV